MESMLIGLISLSFIGMAIAIILAYWFFAAIVHVAHCLEKFLRYCGNHLHKLH